MKTIKKIFVIIACVSFIGMTVSPSSAIPCCCKTRTASSLGKDLNMNQSSYQANSCCSPKKTQSHNCCGMRTNVESPCAFTTTTNINCGHCSCLKHLQLVGISETAKCDRIDGSDLFSSLSIDMSITPHAQFVTSFSESPISPQNQAFLLHCSLRI
jgi:hypothetical protein